MPQIVCMKEGELGRNTVSEWVLIKAECPA